MEADLLPLCKMKSPQFSVQDMASYLKKQLRGGRMVGSQFQRARSGSTAGDRKRQWEPDKTQTLPVPWNKGQVVIKWTIGEIRLGTWVWEVSSQCRTPRWRSLWQDHLGGGWRRQDPGMGSNVCEERNLSRNVSCAEVTMRSKVCLALIILLWFAQERELENTEQMESRLQTHTWVEGGEQRWRGSQKETNKLSPWNQWRLCRAERAD